MSWAIHLSYQEAERRNDRYNNKVDRKPKLTLYFGEINRNSVHTLTGTYNEYEAYLKKWYPYHWRYGDPMSGDSRKAHSKWISWILMKWSEGKLGRDERLAIKKWIFKRREDSWYY
jgi:hypothetical protein